MDTLARLVIGDLTAAERIWSALTPGLVLVAYVVGGLAVYAIRVWRRGPYRDAELEARPRTVLTALWLRLFFAWLMRPLWYLVVRSGVPATAITTLSVLLSVAAAFALAMGRFSLGGWLFIAGGICDFLDGRLARARDRASPAGGFLDSVLDRYSDAAVLVGLAWFYRHDWVLLAVLAALVGSQLTSYVRAKGEALGVSIQVGLMQRAERLLLLGLGVALSPIVEAVLDPHNVRPSHRLAIASLVLLGLSTQATAARRFIYGLRALDHRPFRGFGSLSRGSLARNVVAAAVATVVDFAVFSLLWTRVGIEPGWATAGGCLVGAVVNFTINRSWVFGSRSGAAKQGLRYAFVSSTSAALNAGGVTILLLVPSASAQVAWLAVRGAVYLAWNFPLQRDYVFADARGRDELAESATFVSARAA
ncbi:MAG: CDP-alcohol phosphatidyltransferase [Myxococcales bacterium FL481]|nr:MAG: CDP-alcohol phosphatidyltransferase [Myxococcales bacterium FL481]